MTNMVRKAEQCIHHLAGRIGLMAGGPDQGAESVNTSNAPVTPVAEGRPAVGQQPAVKQGAAGEAAGPSHDARPSPVVAGVTEVLAAAASSLQRQVAKEGATSLGIDGILRYLSESGAVDDLDDDDGDDDDEDDDSFVEDASISHHGAGGTWSGLAAAGGGTCESGPSSLHMGPAAPAVEGALPGMPASGNLAFGSEQQLAGPSAGAPPLQPVGGARVAVPGVGGGQAGEQLHPRPHHPPMPNIMRQTQVALSTWHQLANTASTPSTVLAQQNAQPMHLHAEQHPMPVDTLKRKR